MNPPDPWLDAAEALAKEALAHPGVAALAMNGYFETRGRGHPVCGVALQRSDDRAIATLGVILAADALPPTGIPSLVAALRTRLQRRWDALHTGLPLEVRVHVLDLTEPPSQARQDDQLSA